MLFQIFKYFFPLKERTILETILEIFLKKITCFNRYLLQLCLGLPRLFHSLSENNSLDHTYGAFIHI